MPKGKAQADAKAQHTCKYVSILRRFATLPLGIRCIFEIGSSSSLPHFLVPLTIAESIDLGNPNISLIAKVNGLKILVIGSSFMLVGLFKFVLGLYNDQWSVN